MSAELLERFGLVADENGNAMWPIPAGEWVRYADHASTISRLTAELEAVKRERDEARKALKPFADLIAAIDRDNVVIGRSGKDDQAVTDAEVAQLVLPDKQVMVSQGVMVFGRPGPRPVSKTVTAADFRRARAAGGGDG